MSNFYRVWCEFIPTASNPITGRTGGWRVTSCRETVIPCSRIIKSHTKRLGILTQKPRQPGTWINPRRALHLGAAA